MLILVSGATVTVKKVARHYPGTVGRLLRPGNGNSMTAVQADGLPWACDNGAFAGFDACAFAAFLKKLYDRPDKANRPLFVACPDKVADAKATRELFSRWEPACRFAGPVAYVLQDGQETVPVPWGMADAVFIGGSTAFKLSPPAADLSAKAKRLGKWLHMGRVNSLRRLQCALDLGCDSIDGKSFSSWAERWLAWAVRRVKTMKAQPGLFKDIKRMMNDER